MAEPALWHYTCRHRAALIGRRGVLTPHPQAVLGGVAVVWLTDLDEPDREALGLTSTTLRCDRTEVRYRVLAADAMMPWRDWAESAHVDRTTVSELTFGRRPRHWFVATEPVAVERA